VEVFEPGTALMLVEPIPFTALGILIGDQSRP
jgi:hypothetical protein